MVESGFSVFENIFSASECGAIATALSQDGDKRAGLRNLMADFAIATIAADSRLIEIAKKITGKELRPFKATLFNKAGKANWLVPWHQDTALPLEQIPNTNDWGPASVKEGIIFVHAPTWALQKILALRIHLDPSTAENGPLRVIAGSHIKKIVDDAELRDVVDSGVQEELLVGLGGVVAMSPLLVHASSKCRNDEPRRVLHIEYAESLDLSPEIRLAVA